MARRAPGAGRAAVGKAPATPRVTGHPHKVPIDKGPEMYKTFRDKEDGCIKVVLKPWE